VRRSYLVPLLAALALHATIWVLLIGKGRLPAASSSFPEISWTVEQAADTSAAPALRPPQRGRSASPANPRSVRSARPPVRTARGVEVSVTVAWPKGVKRTRVSGSVPERFAGIERPQRIVLELTVSPRGQVVGMRVTNGGTEPRALGLVRDAVRGWRFAPLRAAAVQRNLVCVVTWSLRVPGAGQPVRRP
jgi:hypothetical protein